MARFIHLFLFLCLLTSPSWASSTRYKPHPAPNHKPKVQAHYSLIDGKRIYGQVTKRATLETTPPNKLSAPTSSATVTNSVPSAQTVYAAPERVISNPLPAPTVQRKQYVAGWFKNTFIHFSVRQHSRASCLNASQANQLAMEITNFVAKQSNPENTTLLLANPGKKHGNNPLTPRLEEALRHAGFAVAQSVLDAPDATLLRYQVSPIDEGILLRIGFLDKEASRYYLGSNGHDLISIYPFSVRLKEERK